MTLLTMLKSFQMHKFVSLLFLSSMAGCVGMKAPYPTATVEPDELEVIPVTADLIAQQIAEATMPSGGMPTPSIVRPSDYRYLVRPGDVLLISVPSIVSFNSPSSPSVIGEQDQGYVVYHDGSIYLPFSGAVQVAGQTLKEVQDSVVSALSGYLRSPQVIVAVKEFRSQRIMVTGQVQKPGYQPISDIPLTLIGAISNAGGISDLRGSGDPRPLGGANQPNQILIEYPDLRSVTLKRENQNYTIDVQKILASGDITQDLLLQDGDVVVVPPVRRTNVFVLGEVLRPGLLEVNRDKTSLADALMATGGINQLTANPSRLYVIRGDYRKPTIFQVDAAHPDAMLLAKKFQLLPSDVIYVSETKSTRWNRSLQQIMPTVQGLLSTAIIANTIDDTRN
jgi:polysaccharide biosynthesis/export protein